MYLVDTNIWLERLLGQSGSDDVGLFLTVIPPTESLISDFSLHSVGVILGRLKCIDILPLFVSDIIDSGVGLVSIAANNLPKVINAMSSFSLDFDDAYQYVAAQQSGATIISYDKDFDRTDISRKTPIDVL